MSLKKWKILESRYVVNNRFLKIRRDKCLLPDGSILSPYFINEWKGFVMIYCLTSDGKVILEHFYKHGVEKIVCELPAGNLEKSDISPISAAKRELLEETGYKADKLESLGVFLFSPSNTPAKVYLFFGQNAKKVSLPKDDASEKAEIVLVSPRKLLAMVKNGKISEIASVLATLLVAEKIRSKQIKL